MHLRKEYILTDEYANDYRFAFDGGDLVISLAEAKIAVAADDIDPFLKQLNDFVTKERKGKKV